MIDREHGQEPCTGKMNGKGREGTRGGGGWPISVPLLIRLHRAEKDRLSDQNALLLVRQSERAWEMKRDSRVVDRMVPVREREAYLFCSGMLLFGHFINSIQTFRITPNSKIHFRLNRLVKNFEYIRTIVLNVETRYIANGISRIFLS